MREERAWVVAAPDHEIADLSQRAPHGAFRTGGGLCNLGDLCALQTKFKHSARGDVELTEDPLKLVRERNGLFVRCGLFALQDSSLVDVVNRDFAIHGSRAGSVMPDVAAEFVHRDRRKQSPEIAAAQSSENRPARAPLKKLR